MSDVDSATCALPVAHTVRKGSTMLNSRRKMWKVGVMVQERMNGWKSTRVRFQPCGLIPELYPRGGWTLECGVSAQGST